MRGAQNERVSQDDMKPFLPIHQNLGRLLALALLATLLGAGTARAGGAPLNKQHKKWLEEEVVYIISDDEKKTFLSLASEEEREKFIQRFWEIRDPTPGTPENEYKDEHYRRIQYANAYFSNEWGEGWRSDRGKVYIILGPPASREHHVSGGDIYPIELWFYSTDEPALPPFFYVMFYQRYGMSDFRLYSPYVDGPDKLVRTSGTENNRYGAYRRLVDYSPELARASLSLIPSEPADLDTISMSSDGMLMKILNLANDKFHKERIEQQGRLREQVTVRITFDVPALEVVALPLRDPAGEPFIHYSLQIPEPQNYSMGRYQDRYYLAMEAQVRVLDAKKKLIYERTREAVVYYTEAQLDTVRTQALDFEDRVPVVPGDYVLEFTLLNRVDRVYHQGSLSVRVEPPAVPALKVGDPILIRHCQVVADDTRPFTIGTSRCQPQARTELVAGPTTSLNLLYPVYLDPAVVTASDQALQVEYTLGRLDHSVANKVTEDTLIRKRFDRSGTLLVGKSVHLGEVPAGAYRLAVRVTDPVSKQSAAITLPFKVGGSPLPLPNVLSPENPAQDELNGNNSYWRGLCALAQNAPQDAAAYFSRALEHNPKHQLARAQAAALYFSQGEYAKVAALLELGGITSDTDVATVQKLLTSLEKTGQLGRAIQTGEQAVTILPPTPELYEQLAGLYDRAGDSGHAQQAREEARRLAERARQNKSENR